MKLIPAMVAVLSAGVSADAVDVTLHSCPPPDTEFETNLVADVWDDIVSFQYLQTGYLTN